MAGPRHGSGRGHWSLRLLLIGVGAFVVTSGSPVLRTTASAAPAAGAAPGEVIPSAPSSQGAPPLTSLDPMGAGQVPPVRPKANGTEFDPPASSDVLRAAEAAKAPKITGYDPATSVEDVAARDRFAVVYKNVDGTRTAQVHNEPVHYKSAKGSWERIDTHVVVDETTPGGLRSAADEWTARFGPSDVGVSFESPSGSFTVIPEKTSAGVVPAVDPPIPAARAPSTPTCGQGSTSAITCPPPG